MKADSIEGGKERVSRVALDLEAERSLAMRVEGRNFAVIGD